MTTIGRDDSLQMIDSFFDMLEVLDPAAGHLMPNQELAEQFAGWRGMIGNFLTLFDPSDIGQVIRDRDDWPIDGSRPEALCLKCGEIFIPTAPEDLIHQQASTGDCGGFGLVEGSWG